MSKEWELIKNIYGCTTILMQETEAKETKNAFEVIEKSLKALEIIKPLCEVIETPVKKFRYLKVNGVVVYTFKTEEEFNLLKGILNEE